MDEWSKGIGIPKGLSLGISLLYFLGGRGVRVRGIPAIAVNCG
jgi:hypothetical protein